VLALKPASETPIFAVEDDERLTLPDEGVVVIHEPLVVAAQVNACAQVPLALMVTACAAGFAEPITPEKFKAAGAAAMVHGGRTAKFTGISCGLPRAVCPVPSVPVSVTIPV